MATYEELFGLYNHSELRNKVTAAIIVAAGAIMGEPPATENHANRLLWAKAAFAYPRGETERMFMALLAANKDATVENIQDASDAAIQTNVDDHVDLFATGG